jgi:hypothetical protein
MPPKILTPFLCLGLILGWGVGSGKAQQSSEVKSCLSVPRFQDYPVEELFSGKPVSPKLTKPEERRFRTVIRQGVAKRYGVVERPGGRERPGPNFAGHYFIITWGCGSPCLMAAIVNAKSGRVLPPPFHPKDVYFQVPWELPMTPLDYRLNSRLLVANICEKDKTIQVDGHIGYQSEDCGSHYFLIGQNGFTLLCRQLEK